MNELTPDGKQFLKFIGIHRVKKTLTVKAEKVQLVAEQTENKSF